MSMWMRYCRKKIHHTADTKILMVKTKVTWLSNAWVSPTHACCFTCCGIFMSRPMEAAFQDNASGTHLLLPAAPVSHLA